MSILPLPLCDKYSRSANLALTVSYCLSVNARRGLPMTVQQRMDKNDRGDEIRWTVGVIVALPIILLAIRGLTC